MADRTGLRAWAHRHSELLDLGAGVAVALAVRPGRVRDEQRTRAAAEQRQQLARELHDAVARQVSIIGIQAAAGTPGPRE